MSSTRRKNISCNAVMLVVPIAASFLATNALFNVSHLSFNSRRFPSPSSNLFPSTALSSAYSSNIRRILSKQSCTESNKEIQPSSPKTKRDYSIPAILVASFLNLLGFTMASPIQPALGEHFSLPMGASFGSLSSAYPLGMMFGACMWPTLSDFVSRKIIMTLTLIGSGIGLLLQSYAIQRDWSLEQFLAARVLTGCFAGNSPISKAYLADKGSNDKQNLIKYLAWKDASSTLAFIVGPALGGLLYRCGTNRCDIRGRLSFVIRFTAVASILASLTITLFVTSNHVRNNKADRTLIAVGDENEHTNNPSDAIVSCPLGTKLWTGVATIACVSSLYHAADSTFFAFFPSLLQERLNLDTGSIGLAFTAFAVVSFITSAFLSSGFIKRYGAVAACSSGLGSIATGLFILSYAASNPVFIGTDITAAVILLAAVLYYTGVPLYGPSVPTMLLQCVPPWRRGAVMGLDGTVNTMARVISPLIMGEIHRRLGAGACFRVAGSCVCAATSLALFRRWLVLRKTSPS